MAEIELGTRRRASRPTSCASASGTACSSAASSSSPRRALLRHGEPGDRGAAGRGGRGGRGPTSTVPSPPPEPRARTAGATFPAPSARSTCTASPASCRSGRASSRCSRRSTAASRSRSRATSTCRSPPPTSSTTRGGPTSSTTPSPAAGARPLGVAGQIIPWNFPLLMAAWKLAPALATGNTVGAEAGGDDAAHRAAARPRCCADAGLPPGVVNIVTGAGGTGAALVAAPRRRQDRVHRLDRGRQSDPAVAGRHAASGSRSSSAARPPTSSSRTPPSTRPSKASSTASTSTRATCAAPAHACWCRSRSPNRSSTS